MFTLYAQNADDKERVCKIATAKTRLYLSNLVGNLESAGFWPQYFDAIIVSNTGKQYICDFTVFALCPSDYIDAKHLD